MHRRGLKSNVIEEFMYIYIHICPCKCYKSHRSEYREIIYFIYCLLVPYVYDFFATLYFLVIYLDLCLCPCGTVFFWSLVFIVAISYQILLSPLISLVSACHFCFVLSDAWNSAYVTVELSFWIFLSLLVIFALSC